MRPPPPRRGSRCQTTAASSSMRTAARSSTSATRRGSCSTASTARRRTPTSRTARARASPSSRRSPSAELDGHTEPNAYGHLPLVDLDPARPATVDGPDNDYWDHVDYIVNKANALGMFVGFLPTLGRYWHDPVLDGRPLFTVANAEVYGEWLGRRYRDSGLVWILGGDRTPENAEQEDLIRAMARGLRTGRRRRAPHHVPPARRRRLGAVVPRRGLARLQHAPERPSGRVHRPLRP